MSPPAPPSPVRRTSSQSSSGASGGGSRALMSHVLLRCVIGDEPLHHIPLHPPTPSILTPALSPSLSRIATEHYHGYTPAVMGVSDESFLPQIVGVFFATFDPVLGPTVLHQVPERLISSSASDADGRRSPSVSRSRSVSRTRTRARASSSVSGPHRTASPLSLPSPAATRETTPTLTPTPLPHTLPHAQPHAQPHTPTPERPADRPLPALLDFSSMSEYVIPKSSLQGKLVIFRTRGNWADGEDSDDDDDADRTHEYKVMGVPSVVEVDGRYKRNQYMWNTCFVFRANASVEAFEPVVRKTARILRSAEIDSGFLSSPKPEHTPIPAVLEQLFEDLNSYSETSIPLDGYNWLELKLFPYFPNPAQVHDWDVPIPLVDFKSLQDANWDITAARVAPHINGVNHAARIAQLADADPALVRETLRHLLYYQVIMMVDIFQYSNMYTTTASFARLTADEAVQAECGTYVTRQGSPVADWPVLAGLYAKLRPGTTLHRWCEVHRITERGIDPRRFVTFGVIKGFLRRVHRWPIVLDRSVQLFLPSSSQPTSTLGVPEHPRRRVGFQRGGDSGFSRHGAGHGHGHGHGPGHERYDRHDRDRDRDRLGAGAGGGGGGGGGGYLERAERGALDSAITIRSESNSSVPPSVSPGSPAQASQRGGSHISQSAYQQGQFGRSAGGDTHPSFSSRRGVRSGVSGMSGGVSGGVSAGMSGGVSGMSAGMSALNSGIDRGSGAGSTGRREQRQVEREDLLLSLLDGHHHADEIQVAFGLSWTQLEKVLGLEDMKGGIGRKGVAVVYN